MNKSEIIGKLSKIFENIHRNDHRKNFQKRMNGYENKIFSVVGALSYKNVRKLRLSDMSHWWDPLRHPLPTPPPPSSSYKYFSLTKNVKTVEKSRKEAYK